MDRTYNWYFPLFPFKKESPVSYVLNNLLHGKLNAFFKRKTLINYKYINLPKVCLYLHQYWHTISSWILGIIFIIHPIINITIIINIIDSVAVIITISFIITFIIWKSSWFSPSWTSSLSITKFTSSLSESYFSKILFAFIIQQIMIFIHNVIGITCTIT